MRWYELLVIMKREAVDNLPFVLKSGEVSITTYKPSVGLKSFRSVEK